jgi:RND family efflux transporter MFP subunit
MNLESTLAGRVAAVLALLCMGTAASACSSDVHAAPSLPPRETPAIPVRTERVAVEDVTRSIQAAGALDAKGATTLSFLNGGYVSALLVEEGAAVHQGQILARLDTTEIDARLRQATEAATKAQRDFDRVAQLSATGALPPAQREDAATVLELAKATLQIAKFARSSSVIVAPTNGRVQRRFAEPGELLGPGAPVLRLASATRGWVVRVGLRDRDAFALRLGDRATVRLDAYPDHPLAANVTEIGTVASPRTGAIDVELALEEIDLPIASGILAKVEIVPARAERVALVPIAALVRADGERGEVFTLAPGGRSARRVPVKVAFFHGDRLAISGGLDGVSGVITDGAPYLSDGAPVVAVE